MLTTLHQINAWIMIVSNAIAAVWCLGAHYRPALRSPWLWRFVIAAQLTIFVQAFLGVAVIASKKLEPPKFHMLYGFSAIIAVGILYSYRPQVKKYEYLLYAGGSAFIMGLGIRAIFGASAG
nr:protein of unknown function (DUF3814) [uncultured bacterium]